MELAMKVKKRREELGWSQEELAKRMGYSSRTSINKIENGRPCSQKIISRLADSLGVSVAYLMGWEEEEKNNDTVADVVDRMLDDSEFLSLVDSLSKLDSKKISAIKQMLDNLL